jgi:hypothetical protein
MARTSYRPPFRVWTTAGSVGLLMACNAVLGMEELPRAPDGSSGRAGRGGSGGSGGSSGSGGSAAGSSNTGGRGGDGESGQAQGGDGGGQSGGKGGSGGASGSGGEAGAAGGSGGAGVTGGSSGNGGAGPGGSGGSSPVCVPDSRECVDGRALHCNLDGSAYESNVECTPNQTCVTGSCEEHQCEPETRFCSASDVRQCAEDGLSSEVTGTCEMNEYCDTESATCEEGVCAPNQPACNDDVATTCNENGSGYAAGGMTCGAGTTCESGACATHVCAPDAVFCQGQELKRCAANGLSSTVVETCDADEYCTAQNGGSCPAQVCSPGTRTCSGNTSRLCNTVGSGTVDTVCSGGFCDSSSGGCRTPGEIVGALDGRLIQRQCTEASTGDDCAARVVVDGVATNCVSGGVLTAVQDHAIGGTPGVEYQVTIHFYGIVEPKSYGNNITRESGGTRPVNLATGATPIPWASSAPGVSYLMSDYSTYEIHVYDHNMTARAQYFLNSDTSEGHWTYVLNFTKAIPVIGGGLVRLRSSDRNCRIIKNCNLGGSPCSAKARTVDVSAAIPQPVFTQPGLNQTPEHAGQWLLLDVTGVQ